jgi:hypothetical protein
MCVRCDAPLCCGRIHSATAEVAFAPRTFGVEARAGTIGTAHAIDSCAGADWRASAPFGTARRREFGTLLEPYGEGEGEGEDALDHGRSAAELPSQRCEMQPDFGRIERRAPYLPTAAIGVGARRGRLPGRPCNRSPSKSVWLHPTTTVRKAFARGRGREQARDRQFFSHRVQWVDARPRRYFYLVIVSRRGGSWYE